MQLRTFKMRDSTSEQARYLRVERAMFEALCRRHPMTDRKVLRIAAMVSVGATRLAIDSWNKETPPHPLEYYLRETFTLIKSKFPGMSRLLGEQAGKR